MWNVFEAQIMAAKGGKARTAEKRAASRKNGEKGGRKRQRTLAESILRRTLSRAEHDTVREAFFRLTSSEQDIFRKFFGLPLGDGRKKSVKPYFDPATRDGVRANKPSKRMRHILKKFRLVARWRLAGGI